MTTEDIRTRLRIVAKRGKLPPGFELDDVVNEAFRVALAEDPSLQEEALLERAKLALSEIRRDDYWRAKREHSVGAAAKNATDGKPTFRRRSSVRRKLPKGTIRFATQAIKPGLLPVGEGDLLDDDHRGAAERLACEGLLRIAAGETCSFKAKRLLADLYCEVYGVPPGAHWAHLLVIELERAKRQSFEFARSKEEAVAESFAMVTRKGQKREKLRLISIQTPTLPGRARQDYFIEEKGERVLVGRCVGILGDEFVYSNDDTHRSEEILVQVRLQLTQLHFTHQIPAYADDPVLIRWLFARFGFGGGGGANAMKTETLRRLLLDPEALSAEILKHGQRLAERVGEDEGAALERETAALASRVGSRSARVTSEAS